MLHLALGLMLAAEPMFLPEATAAPIEETAPAPRWPAAPFFIGGGLTLWAGVAELLVIGMMMQRTGIGGPPDMTDVHIVGAALISFGFLSMLAGTFWLVWTRSSADLEPAESPGAL